MGLYQRNGGNAVRRNGRPYAVGIMPIVVASFAALAVGYGLGEQAQLGEQEAQSLRIPIDEVKAIILQAHPAPAQPKRPEFLEPRYALEKPAGIGDNRRES